MSSGGLQAKLRRKGRHRGGASKKLVVLVLLIAAMAPIVGAVLNGGSNKNAQTTVDTTVTGQSRTVSPSLPMPAIPQTATNMIASKSIPFDSLRTDYSVAKYDFSRGPVAYMSGGTADALTNGVPVTGFVNGTGDWEMWYMNVSSGARYMRIVLAAEPGNYLSLYGRLNAIPTTSSYDWSQGASNNMDLSLNSLLPGKWYIMAYSQSCKGTYLLTVTVLYSSNPQPLTNGATVTGSLNATADSDLYYIDVVSGATSMHSVLTCPSGTDFDVYGRWASYPDTHNYYWWANAAGNEDFSYGSPSAGRWFIMPFSYFGNGSYELTVTIAYAPVAQLLSSGVTATGSLSGSGDSDFWCIYVQSGASSMHSVLTCPSGAYFTLYGRYESYPTTSYYDWIGTGSGGEDVTYGYPSSGYWYIMVHDSSGNGTYQLTVTVTAPFNAQYLYSGSTVTGSLGYGASDYYYIYVQSGASSMHSVLTCPSGAYFTLYGRYESYPTTSYYDWIGTGSGGEDVTYGYPSSGYWYIMVRASSVSGTYSLTVTINYGGQVQVDPNAILGPIAVVFTVIFVFIFVLLAASRRNTLGSGRGSNYHPSQAPPMESGMEGERRQEAAAVRMLQCKSCGASLKPSDNNCWNCGAPAKASLVASSVPGARRRVRIRSGICMVCKRGLEKADEILFCPYCGGLAHKDHMLEWLHVKDYCPTCGRHLDEAEVRKQTDPESGPKNRRRQH